MSHPSPQPLELAPANIKIPAAMKSINISWAASNLVFLILLSFFLTSDSVRHINQHKAYDDVAEDVRSHKVGAEGNMYTSEAGGRSKGVDTLQIAGSSLPDCSHACGSCTPCQLVMVSFVCSSLEEAEPCPMAYKCMCNNKSYPVP